MTEAVLLIILCAAAIMLAVLYDLYVYIRLKHNQNKKAKKNKTKPWQYTKLPPKK